MLYSFLTIEFNATICFKRSDCYVTRFATKVNLKFTHLISLSNLKFCVNYSASSYLFLYNFKINHSKYAESNAKLSNKNLLYFKYHDNLLFFSSEVKFTLVYMFIEIIQISLIRKFFLMK